MQKRKGSKYWPADDAKVIGQELIPQYHSHLAEATIIYVFVEKMKDKGKVALAKLKPASAMEDYLGTVDFVMEINDETWKNLTPDQRTALVDHELCHGVSDVNDEGGITYGTKGHDVEEFFAIIERRGLWAPDLETFAAVMAEQLPLELTGGKKTTGKYRGGV